MVLFLPEVFETAIFRPMKVAARLAVVQPFLPAAADLVVVNSRLSPCLLLEPSRTASLFMSSSSYPL